MAIDRGEILSVLKKGERFTKTKLSEKLGKKQGKELTKSQKGNLHKKLCSLQNYGYIKRTGKGWWKVLRVK